MIFKQIRSATSIITYADKRFLIDPMLAPQGTYPAIPYTVSTGKGNPDCELPCQIEDLLNVDAVIVTHLHFDHFDETAAKFLPKHLPLFSQSAEDAEKLNESGFKDVRILDENGITFSGITLIKTPCDHGSSDAVTSFFYQEADLEKDACGVVFKANGEKTFYLAGDTIFYQGVSNAICQYRPQVIAVNAAGAQFPLGHALIMNQYDVLVLMRKFPEIEVIATHVEGVSHATVTRSLLRDFARENQLTKLKIPNDGQTFSF